MAETAAATTTTTNNTAEQQSTPSSGNFTQEVQAIGKEALDTIIGNGVYQHVTSNQWSQSAVETITTNLVKLNKPYKYVVTCVIMQTNTGAGLSVSSTCYWDKSTDLIRQNCRPADSQHFALQAGDLPIFVELLFAYKDICISQFN